MEDIDKAKLKENFNYIAENTTNLEKFLTLLLQEGIIESREREAIKSGITSYDRNVELYDYVMKKCPFETLLLCLEESSNEHIAKKLQSTKIFQEREKTIVYGISTSPFYIGRDDEMQKLHSLWMEHRDGNKVPFVSIYGSDGIGKSLFVNKFLHLFRETTDGSCIYINAETIQTATVAIRTLAQKLQISLWDVDHREKVLATLATEVYRVLSKMSCVLVFDNIENYEQPLIKSIFQVCRNSLAVSGKTPFVILVSQCNSPKEDFGFRFEEMTLTPILEELPAVKYFTENPKVQIFEPELIETIKELCHILKYHPTAVELAFHSIILPDDSSLEKELPIFINEAEKLINNEAFQDNSLKNHLDESILLCYVTWKICWKRILMKSLEAKSLMDTIAFFSSDTVRLSFLFDLVSNDKALDDTSLKAAYKILTDCTFIASTPPGKDEICPRKLFQKFSLMDMEKDEMTARTLASLLNSMHVKLKTEKTFPIDQISHIISTWTHSTKYEELIVKHLELPVWICLNLFQNGRWEDVSNFSEWSSRILSTVVDDENPWMLRLLYWRGRIQFQRGVYVDSLNILTNVFEKQVSREYLHHSLITAHRIALIFFKQGEKEKALKWLTKTLNTRKMKFGEEHRNTQWLKNDMASVLQSLGEYKKARNLFEEVYSVRVRILSENHPETVMTKFHIGHLLLNCKKLNEAIGIFKEVKEMRERILEPDHCDTVRVKHFMALTYKCMGRWRVAFPLAKEVFEKRVKFLGEEHPYTNYTRNLLRQLKQNLDRIQ